MRTSIGIKNGCPPSSDDATAPAATIHTNNWTTQLASDLAAAKETIVLSSMSIHAPHANARGPWPNLWRILTAAPARGIRTYVVLPRPSTIHPATARNADAAARLAPCGIHIQWAEGGRLWHAKSHVIDREILWIGSANLTAQASTINREVCVRLYSPLLAAYLHSWILGEHT